MTLFLFFHCLPFITKNFRIVIVILITFDFHYVYYALLIVSLGCPEALPILQGALLPHRLRSRCETASSLSPTSKASCILLCIASIHCLFRSITLMYVTNNIILHWRAQIPYIFLEITHIPSCTLQHVYACLCDTLHKLF
jgi:hypothetical protein